MILHPVKAQFDNVLIGPETPIGTIVKPSVYAIKPKRDYWLSCGRAAQKSAAKQELDAEIDKRGILEETAKNGCKVIWDNGSESHCLHCLVVTA